MPSEHPFIVSGNDYLIYDNGAVHIRLQSVKGAEKAEIGRIFRYNDISRFTEEYHIIRMDAKKLVDNKVSLHFDAIMLMFDSFTYKKPQNYFDLLIIAERYSDGEMRNFISANIQKGRVQLSNEETMVSYLIFNDLPPNESNASLVYNNVYIDQEDIIINIPFTVNYSYDPDITERMGF